MNTRQTLAIGSDTRPPIFYRGDFSQWKSQFLDFIAKNHIGPQILESLQNGPITIYTTIPAVPDDNPLTEGGIFDKDPKNYTPEEADRVRGDVLSKS